MKLHAKRSGSGDAVLLLHGLFGAGGNLGALARELQQSYAVTALDLPGHGRSEWLPEPDLPQMAACIEQWMRAQGIATAALVGHSLGGKVAMQLALDYPLRVSRLVVVDIAPVAYEGRHDAVFAALEAVAAGQCTSRASAAELMTAQLGEPEVIQFLLSSLQRGADGVYHWRFDLEGLREAYPALLAAPSAASPWRGPALFIKGGDSDYIGEEHRAAIQALFPRAELRVMPGCGHWLHAEKPQLFNSIVARFLGASV